MVSIFLPNVPSDLSLLAFGIPPAREAESAGGMPKVPKAWELSASVCSTFFCVYCSDGDKGDQKYKKDP